MTLPVGTYRTKRGSTMTVSGEHGDISSVKFDWFEECGCRECRAQPYDIDGYLVWDCAECDGGKAKLEKVK